jgi:hypothetical protein
MLVWTKDTAGKWVRTGEVLPTEKLVQILRNADKPSGPAYPVARALAIVEAAIAKGQTGDTYRYDLAPATTKAKAKAAKVRPARKQPKPHKKETGHQRRVRLIREGLCTCCGKRKPAKRRDGKLGKECSACKKYQADWAAKQAGK